MVSHKFGCQNYIYLLLVFTKNIKLTGLVVIFCHFRILKLCYHLKNKGNFNTRVRKNYWI